MALRTDDLIDRARNRHPSFTAQLIPNGVAFDYVNETQRRLYRRIHLIDADYLAQRWVIALLPNQNVAAVGAGLSGEAPLEIGTDDLERRLVNTGAEALVSLSTSVYVQETAVAAATGTTLQASGVSWTTDQWQNSIVQIVSGLGAGQQRDIAGNSADTLTVTEAWTQTPDTTSTFLVREAVLSVDGDHGAILGQQPNTAQDLTYLVKLDANGRPFIDLAQPVVVNMQLGIPLPPGQYINHGHVFFIHGEKYPDWQKELTLVPMIARYSPPNNYSAAVQGRELFLCPPFDQWSRVERIEIPYLPIPPRITKAEEYVSLPDDAEDALVGGVVLGMCDRIEQLGGTTSAAGLGSIRQRAMEAEGDYLALVTGSGRAEVDQIQDVGY